MFLIFSIVLITSSVIFRNIKYDNIVNSNKITMNTTLNNNQGYHPKVISFEKAFESKKFAYKGMDISVDTKAYVKDNEYMKKDDSKEKIGEKCYFYLNKIIATCKKNNIELLLIELPSAESWSYDLSEKTQEFANNKGLDFIDLNLNYKDFGFDWNTDSADGGDHLNVYGAEKVSKYIGKIIQEKYNIPNRKQDLNCSDWY